MRLKLTLTTLYVVVVLGATASAVRPPSTQLTNPIVRLDVRGTRGLVLFDHKKHEGLTNPNPNAVIKAAPGASCAGCHHTISASTGTPQLWKCASCHRGPGDPKNPTGKDSSNIWAKTAFHRLCIDCHDATKKGPVKCGDCHR
jgi:hypothetical protein